MRVELPRRPLGPGPFLLLLCLVASRLFAAPRPDNRPLTVALAAPPGRTTLVIFADQSLPSGEWPALFAALRSALAGGAGEMRVLHPDPILIRADDMAPGTLVQSPVVVFLHGDCRLEPRPPQDTSGAVLGWVWLSHEAGRPIIQPFVHVDCTVISEVLGQRSLGMSDSERDDAMADAIAQVILHEWIHIATQNAGHEPSGVMKAAFGPDDLLRAYRPAKAYRPQTRKTRAATESPGERTQLAQ